jgi:hypothetical protein
MSEPTQEQPEVTTRSPWRVSRIPDHLGRARTSTVVMSVLFLAIFALYLNIRPETPGTVPSGTGAQVPASTTAPAPAPQTTAPTTQESTQDQPTTQTSTPTDLPTGTSTPEPPTDSTTPTTSATLPTPTVSTPSG